jgi:hypothetical protein
MGLFDIFKKKRAVKPDVPKIWPPISKKTIRKSIELAEAVIAEISASGYFKPEKLPELSDRIMKLAVYSLYNFSDPFNYEDCLTLEEKRNLNFNTRQKISREMLGFMTEDGLHNDDPKMIIKKSYARQLKIINDKNRTETYKSVQAKSNIFSGYRFLATLSTKTCLACGALDGKIFDTPELPNVCLNEHCRCLMVPEVRGLEGFDEDDTRASDDGPVPASWTYNDWLKKQPKSMQKRILGDLYDMFNDGVSLTELMKLKPECFKAVLPLHEG